MCTRENDFATRAKKSKNVPLTRNVGVNKVKKGVKNRHEEKKSALEKTGKKPKMALTGTFDFHEEEKNNAIAKRSCLNFSLFRFMTSFLLSGKKNQFDV